MKTISVNDDKQTKKRLEKLISSIRANDKRANIELIEKSYNFADECHKNQLRKSGEKFLSHPLAVATLLASLKMDSVTIAAALLHDVVEDTEISLETIKKKFGQEVADLIDGLTKLELIKFSSHEHEQAENIRKMIIAMAKDIRVILIKLADRLHNMQTISYLNKEQQVKKAHETLDIYAPLSHRLGISQFKWQLEDLSFDVLHPKEYEQINKMVAERRDERERYLKKTIITLNKVINEVGAEADISGRPKHLYSIYQKMIKKGKEFSEIYDLIAVRVIVGTVRDCYAALGAIHSKWTPIPGRFKDYIATPKFNMYQSLHTTVIGLEGKPLEIQIRTDEMNKTAEYGIAAHWKYKSLSGIDDDNKAERFNWLNGILEWQRDLKDPKDFIESLKIDLFADEVFVFTPKGRVVSLPADSSPVDFAYSIHTDVGNTCIGAKANNRIVTLDYKLQHGDIVEILTSKNSHPSRDWLKLTKTGRARSKIRQWFSKHSKEENLQFGREIFNKSLKKSKIAVNATEINDKLEKIASFYNFKTTDDLFAGIGNGAVSSAQVITRLNLLSIDKTPDVFEIKAPKISRDKRSPVALSINVVGFNDMLVRLSKCCNPMPGDEIIGFITRGRGISVHRRDCMNSPALLKQPERQVEVSWNSEQAGKFPVEIEVVAFDRKGLLRDITQVLSDIHINIKNAKVNTPKNDIAVIRLGFDVMNLSYLENILTMIKRINSITDSYRVIPGKKNST